MLRACPGKKAELIRLARDHDWTLPDEDMTKDQLKVFLRQRDGQMHEGMTKMTFGKYKGTHTFEEVCCQDRDYCQWCLSTEKPSAKMEEFMRYVRAQTISGSTDQKPTDERAQSRSSAATDRKRNHSDDEWISMDTSSTSATAVQAPTLSQYAASATVLLNRVLDQIDQAPGATRTLQKATQMVREQWMEVSHTVADPETARAWMQRDASLAMIGRSS